MELKVLQLSNFIHTNHNDMVIVHHNGGLKWVRKEKHSTRLSIDPAVLFQMPACVYFMNTDSRCELSNENSAAVCGWDSPKHFHGKSVIDCFERDTAKRIMQCHQDTMLSAQAKFTEDDVQRKNDVTLHCLTLNLPWLNDDNKIAGVFGCSIVVEQQPVAEIMTQLMNLNLLSNPNTRPSLFPEIQIEGVYLSRREKECLQHCVRGKSAKQIARILGLSHRTIEHYIDNIKFKLKVTSKSELIDKVTSL